VKDDGKLLEWIYRKLSDKGNSEDTICNCYTIALTLGACSARITPGSKTRPSMAHPVMVNLAVIGQASLEDNLLLETIKTALRPLLPSLKPLLLAPAAAPKLPDPPVGIPVVAYRGSSISAESKGLSS
jgi:hypothetical protein